MKLLEQILPGAKDITQADGGTSGKPIPFNSIPQPLPDGSPNRTPIVACAVLDGTTVNIPDAYHAPGFDFSGMRAFDLKTGYRFTSFLTVPLRNHEAGDHRRALPGYSPLLPTSFDSIRASSLSRLGSSRSFGSAIGLRGALRVDARLG